MRSAVLVSAVVLVVSAATAPAQSRKQFRARLSPVPIDIAMQNVVAGRGSVSATLTGSKVVLSGTFADLKSPATIANVHVAPKGMRGPVAFALKVSGGTSGTIGGEFELTPAQQDDLIGHRLYVQLHSEKAPEGNLRGWLLQEAKR